MQYQSRRVCSAMPQPFGGTNLGLGAPDSPHRLFRALISHKIERVVAGAVRQVNASNVKAASASLVVAPVRPVGGEAGTFIG